MWPHSRRRDTLQSANILQNKFTSLNLENIIVIYTIMTIKGKECCAGHLAIWSKMVPTAAMWPHSWRRDTLQSANILRNKFTLLNLENSIVIYTILTINSLTPICLLAGIKNYCSLEFLRKNSTFFCVFQNTTQPPTTTTMVSRLPLLRNGLGGYAQSNTRETRPRVSARALLLGFV